MASERKNSRVTDHPKLLNPLSPKNKKKILGINSIKEENGEESLTFRDCCEKINFKEIDFHKNKLENNNSNEDGDHSTSGSSKSQISSIKSNNSTPEICKIFNKNDNTPIQNEDLFKITPHFINENVENKNIQLNFNICNNNNEKNKKVKFARPLTPNLNIIKKCSAPICQNEANKLIGRINNDKGYLINECQKSLNNKEICNKIKEKDSNKNLGKNLDFNMNINMDISKRLSQEVAKTDTNIKRHSYSCAKKKILKNCGNLHTNSSINENFFNKNNNINKNRPIKNNIYSSIKNTNSNYINKIPFSFNSNRNMQSKKIISNNTKCLTKQNTQRKNSSKVSRRISNTSMNKSIDKKSNRNSSKYKNEIIINNKLIPYKSENKIKVVHSKVNNEINNLFNGLSENIAKDPEIHNKIESLIKDIKDIQQVVQRKTQTHFRPRKQNNDINCRKK